jgi:hypothetical protein
MIIITRIKIVYTYVHYEKVLFLFGLFDRCIFMLRMFQEIHKKFSVGLQVKIAKWRMWMFTFFMWRAWNKRT